MKKLILTGSAVAVMAFAGAAASIATAATPGPTGPTDGVEGCSILGNGGPGGGTCSYSPTSAGGFVGKGNFTLTLYSLVNGVQTPVATLNATNKQGCAEWSPNATGAVYNNVDLVTGTVADNNSGVAFGDPFPTQLQSSGSGQTAC